MYISIYLSSLSINLSIFLSIYISIYLPIYQYIYLMIYLTFYLLIYPTIYQSIIIYIFICLTLYLFDRSQFACIYSIAHLSKGWKLHERIVISLAAFRDILYPSQYSNQSIYLIQGKLF